MACAGDRTYERTPLCAPRVENAQLLARSEVLNRKAEQLSQPFVHLEAL